MARVVISVEKRAKFHRWLVLPIEQGGESWNGGREEGGGDAQVNPGVNAIDLS